MTSSGGMAVPTFHVTTEILGRWGYRRGYYWGPLSYPQPPSHRAFSGEISLSISPQKDPQWAQGPFHQTSKGDQLRRGRQVP